MAIALSGSVGAGGTNNAEDVKKVQQRLNDLGFTFVGTVDGLVGAKTIGAIKLLQSIKSGSQEVGGDGRVDVAGDTHKWLEATNAPHWLKMPSSGDGFVNIEVQDPNDLHDFGTDWLADMIEAAGAKYKTSHLDSHTASSITVNDAALPEGGDSPDHAGHETGLSCDLRLPKKNTAGASPAGLTVASSDYDREAARAILKAYRAQPLSNHDRIFLNDQTLIDEGLCKHSAGHDNHIHVEVKPPAREP